MRRLVVLFLPCLFSLVGCASIGGLVGSPGVPDRDICNLLTSAEVDQYMGWPDTVPQSETENRAVIRQYRP